MVIVMSRYKNKYMHNKDINKHVEEQSSYFEDPFALSLFTSFFGMTYGFFKYEIALSNSVYRQQQQIPLKRVAMVSIIAALIHLLGNTIILLTSFTTYNLFHSCDLLSVVIFAVFCSKLSSKSDQKVEKHYIVTAIIVCTGILIFQVMGEKQNKGANHPLTIWSLLLIIILLGLGGFYPDLVAQIKVDYHPPPSLLFYQINRITFFIILFFSIVSGYLWHTAKFIWQHDTLSLDLMINSILSVIGQIFIYRILVLHKQHVIPFILTVRKLFTSVFNIVYFHHKINGFQMIGLILVGVGITISLSFEYMSKKYSKQFKEIEQIEDTI